MQIARPAEFGRIAVLSPHLDDAALSCGALLAAAPGALTITVFAGAPDDRAMQTEWDSACGFSNAGEAIAQRRAEDQAALAKLGAVAVWLDFCDSQYRQPAQPAQAAGMLAELLREQRVDSVLLPAGLFHADHLFTHEAALAVRREQPQLRWLMYEDVPYRRIDGLLQQRLALLQQIGVSATPLAINTNAMHADAKRAALACYASQLRGMHTPGRPGVQDAHTPERYWRLAAMAQTR
jgi:LmbE family N-acetylglucosaminyl deacetylase